MIVMSPSYLVCLAPGDLNSLLHGLSLRSARVMLLDLLWSDWRHRLDLR